MKIKSPESLFQLTLQDHEIIVSFNIYRVFGISIIVRSMHLKFGGKEGKNGFHGRRTSKRKNYRLAVSSL